MTGSKSIILAVLTLLCFSTFFIAGCNSTVNPNDLKEVDNNALIIPDLIHYFEKNKVPIETVQLIRADVAHADDAVSIKVAGKEIGIYKYNVKVKIQREKLAKIENEKFVYLIGFKKNVLVNGSFVMVGWEDNPQKELLENVFMSFSNDR